MRAEVNYRSDSSPRVVEVVVDEIIDGVWYVDIQTDIVDPLITYSSGVTHGDPRMVVMVFHNGHCTEVTIDPESNDDFATGIRSVLHERYGTQFFVIARRLAARRRQVLKLSFIGDSDDH